MEIQVARLREVLGLLKPAVPRKPTLPSLTNALFKDGRAVATNMETMVAVSVPEADETMLFPYTAFSNLLDYIPGDQTVKLNRENGNIVLTSDYGEKASYPSVDPKEFPDVPDFKPVTESDIDGDSFMRSLIAALPYVATETERPVLNGVTVIFGSPIEIAAGDGFRLSHQVLPIEFPGNTVSIIPSGAINILSNLWKKTPRTPPASDTLIPVLIAKKRLHVALDGNSHLQVDFGGKAVAIIKLVEGKPPSWIKLFPKGDPVLRAQVFAPEFETAVRRVKDVAMGGSGIVRMEFEEDAVRISAQSDGREVATKISVLGSSGAPNRVALNVKYLLSYLKEKEGVIAISWTGDMSPVCFDYSKTPRVLIMPMDAKWDKPLPGDTPPAEAAPVASSKESPGPAKPSKPRKKEKKA